jgi:hypothetical protein
MQKSDYQIQRVRLRQPEERGIGPNLPKARTNKQRFIKRYSHVAEDAKLKLELNLVRQGLAEAAGRLAKFFRRRKSQSVVIPVQYRFWIKGRNTPETWAALKELLPPAQYRRLEKRYR